VSVAFRRESDEEHKEPRFELPLPPGPNLVTARGLEQIGARIGTLERELAAAQGEAVEALRRELRYWSTRKTTAQPTPAPADGTVGFGTRVSFTLAGKARTIDIVGDDEAEPEAGRVAFSAPLARAMLGAEAGERVAFNGREDAIRIDTVTPLEEKSA
jgi:transcription elongation GreA/GreB family factor